MAWRFLGRTTGSGHSVVEHSICLECSEAESAKKLQSPNPRTPTPCRLRVFLESQFEHQLQMIPWRLPSAVKAALKAMRSKLAIWLSRCSDMSQTQP